MELELEGSCCGQSRCPACLGDGMTITVASKDKVPGGTKLRFRGKSLYDVQIIDQFMRKLKEEKEEKENEKLREKELAIEQYQRAIFTSRNN